MHSILKNMPVVHEASSRARDEGTQGLCEGTQGLGTFSRRVCVCVWPEVLGAYDSCKEKAGVRYPYLRITSGLGQDGTHAGEGREIMWARGQVTTTASKTTTATAAGK